MKVRFHPIARTELREAYDHYSMISPVLTSRFAMEFLRIVNLIVENPTAWRAIGRRTRRRNLHRFPYGVIYQVLEDHIRIVAVAHLKRRPGYWRKRL